jgi:hypothetical protein
MLLVSDAAAGAWTKELGEAYAKVSVDLYRTLEFVRAGTASQGGAYTGEQVTAYGEVGVLRSWRTQVTLAAPFVVGTHAATIHDPLGPLDVRATTARLGDLRLGTQVALHRKAPIAAAVEVKVPLYSNDSVGEGHPSLAPLFPVPGDGQIDITAWLGAGRAWGPTFVEAALGYRHRTEWFVAWHPPDDIAFVDGFPWVLKGGHQVGRVLLLAGTEGIVNPTDSQDGSSQVTREFASLFAAALVDVAHGIAIEPRLWGEVWAQHTSQGVGAGLGVSFRR